MKLSVNAVVEVIIKYQFKFVADIRLSTYRLLHTHYIGTYKILTI